MISVTLPAIDDQGAQWPSRLLIRCSIYFPRWWSLSLRQAHDGHECFRGVHRLRQLTAFSLVLLLLLGQRSEACQFNLYTLCQKRRRDHHQQSFSELDIAVGNPSYCFHWIPAKQASVDHVGPLAHGFRTGVSLTMSDAKPHRIRRYALNGFSVLTAIMRKT